MTSPTSHEAPNQSTHPLALALAFMRARLATSAWEVECDNGWIEVHRTKERDDLFDLGMDVTEAHELAVRLMAAIPGFYGDAAA